MSVSLSTKAGSVDSLEARPAMRAEAVRLPDHLDRRRGNASRLRHRAQRPVGCFVRRRLLCQADDLGDTIGRDRSLAGRTRLVAKQSVDAFVHEPLLPAPYTGFGLSGLGHDRRGAQTIATQKHDTRPPYVFLTALGVRDDRSQSLTVAGRYDKGLYRCACARLACHNTTGNPKSDSFVPIKPLGWDGQTGSQGYG